MSTPWQRLSGILTRGHQVASRPSAAYPYGTLEKQIPCFKALGLDLSPFFAGTLNISIAPLKFELTAPEMTFPLVEWTDLHPPETFSFSRCMVWRGAAAYPGWIYFPHPETKKAHFQNPSLLEVITFPIPGIQYGHLLTVGINPGEIRIF